MEAINVRDSRGRIALGNVPVAFWRGKKLPRQVAEKIRASLIGRKRPDEVKKKIASTKKGKPLSSEHLSAIRVAARSRRMSEEQRSVSLAKRRAYQKRYKQTRKYKEWRNGWLRRKYHDTDSPEFKLYVLLRSRLHKAVRRGRDSTASIRCLGCSVAELRRHIESLFTDGMTWDNWRADGWHIDHKIPLDAFDLTDDEQVRRACHYTNLQPLWARENLLKSNKV